MEIESGDYCEYVADGFDFIGLPWGHLSSRNGRHKWQIFVKISKIKFNNDQKNNINF
jgi:hypothetical protein